MASWTGPSYVFWCTDCYAGFNSKHGWIRHLVLEQHQDLVAKGSRTWTEDDLDRCVVVFPEEPSRTNPATILKHFGDLGRGLLASNLVWNERKGDIMVLQFESRFKVDQLFTAVGGGSEVLVANQTLQIKKFMDYLPFERKAFFPTIGRQPQLSKPTTTPTATLATSSTSAPLPTSPPSALKSLLVADFEEIQSATEIPDSEFQNVLTLLQKLQKILSQHLPNCKLFLFRHWYLKLKTPGTNELLIFVQHDNLLQKRLQQSDFLEFFHKQDSRRILPNVKMVKPRSSKISYLPDRYGNSFQDSSSGILFSLVVRENLFTEMQTCQLLKHLICRDDPDPRVRALMLLVFYWATKNDENLQIFKWSANATTLRSNLLTPAPGSLEWLVIFFLSNRKVLPAVKQVVKKESFDQPLESRLSNPPIRIKPDFLDNNPFLENEIPQDSPDFVIAVVKLAEQFFSFYGDHLQNDMTSPCILNTRDGQLIQVKSVKDPGDEQGSWDFQGNQGELGDDDKQVLSNDVILRDLFGEITRQTESRVKTPVYILHPLYFAHRFPLGSGELSETWRKMRVTATRLRVLLQVVESEEGAGCQVSLKEALKLSTTEPVKIKMHGKKRK